jgi:outer membrane protein OmpA-like peptidoglycan-associated protein
MSRAASAVAALGLAAWLAGCENVRLPASLGSVTRLAQAGGDLKGAFVDMDEPEEVELGRAVTAGVGARYRLLRDENLTRYVALVGNAVAAHSDRPDLRYYFAVLDTHDVNAFAAPGGYVFITRGTLNVMRDEATLAGVLGHEVAHVALHHHGQTIKAEKRKALAVTGLQEGLAHTKTARFAQMITATADQLTEQIVIKGFSRTEEMESDAAGFKYATRAGYDAAGLRDFLKSVQEQSRSQPAVATFFSTHPGTEDRLREQETLLRTAAAGGQRNVARFERAMGRRAPAVAQPPIVAPPTSARSEFLQMILASGRYVTHAVAFDTGSDRVRPEFKRVLKEIADGLVSTPTLRVRVEGHTDSTGDATRNVELSQRRADAIRTVLVSEFGIDPRRLAAVGLGAARPVASNSTPEGRAINRRVEFVREPDAPAR